MTGAADGDDGATPGARVLAALRRPLRAVHAVLVRRPGVLDALVVACFTGWALLLGLGADSMYLLSEALEPGRVLTMQLASLGLTLAGAVALSRRRHRPVVVAAVLAVLGVLSLVVTGWTAGFEVGLALALYAVAVWGPPRALWPTVLACVAALLVAAASPLARTVGAIVVGAYPDEPQEVATVTRGGALGFLQSLSWYVNAGPVLLLALLAVTLGVLVRARRERAAAAAAEEAARAAALEQRERLDQAAERARIAREMHDVVAHGISVMVTLGGGASAAFEYAPDRARAALDELVDTGRAALADMRRILGVLHDDGAQDASAAPRAPQPGGLDVVRLVEGFRTAGLPVRTTGLATLDGLDATVQLAVHRIVQESLTNVLRHARGTDGVRVEVERRADAVEVVVVDEGGAVPPTPSPGSGRGLVGMRERAAVFGGTVEAGPHGRGWRVRALLPLPEADA
ncbi:MULTISPECIES: sensor histidine kinase [Cellulomonas]|uniref:sensor histidine kinase n=1 Tax=Cellulomonas TaxID=1707 RepID=UPI0010A76AF7|nr:MULTISPECIES: histidine kinase [Cellulomonas]